MQVFIATVHFNTDDFIQILEYASRLEHNEVVAPNYKHIPFEINIRRGNDHIGSVMINHLRHLYQTELYAGTQITPIGFPVVDGVGSLMLPKLLFGIGASAQNLSNCLSI